MRPEGLSYVVVVGADGTDDIVGSHIRNAPRKAFWFAPSRTFGGRSPSFFALPHHDHVVRLDRRGQPLDGFSNGGAPLLLAETLSTTLPT